LKVVVIMRLNDDVLSPKSGELAVEFVSVRMLFEVKAWYKVVIWLVTTAAFVYVFGVVIKEAEGGNKVVVRGAEGGEEVCV
jgi:hypothetical protein